MSKTYEEIKQRVLSNTNIDVDKKTFTLSM